MKTRNNSLTFMLAIGLMLLLGFGSVQAQSVEASSKENASSSSKNIEFSNASLKGRYSFINQVSSIAASFGTLTFDGEGNATNGSATGNTIIRNAAGQLDSLVFPFPFTGTYSLNADGLGRVVFTATLPDGSTKDSNYDFVVSEVEKINGRLIATELRAVQRERDRFSGSFGQALVKRLGDKGDKGDK